jgi:membrane-bound lytic murein transglycosylase B
LGRATTVAALHTTEPTIAATPAPTQWSGTWRALYQRAAPTCPGLPWQVLAAIGSIESGNGRDIGPSSAGALGPMQFLPSTWADYGIDADGDGRANIMSPVDAVYSAARYLCDNGAGRGGRALASAIYAYNHANWYVADVLALASRIG